MENNKKEVYIALKIRAKALIIQNCNKIAHKVNQNLLVAQSLRDL